MCVIGSAPIRSGTYRAFSMCLSIRKFSILFRLNSNSNACASTTVIVLPLSVPQSSATLELFEQSDRHTFTQRSTLTQRSNIALIICVRKSYEIQRKRRRQERQERKIGKEGRKEGIEGKRNEQHRSRYNRNRTMEQRHHLSLVLHNTKPFLVGEGTSGWIPAELIIESQRFKSPCGRISIARPRIPHRLWSQLFDICSGWS